MALLIERIHFLPFSLIEVSLYFTYRSQSFYLSLIEVSHIYLSFIETSHLCLSLIEESYIYRKLYLSIIMYGSKVVGLTFKVFGLTFILYGLACQVRLVTVVYVLSSQVISARLVFVVSSHVSLYFAKYCQSLLYQLRLS